MIEHSRETAKGRNGDGGGSTERPYESKNLGVIHMEGVIGAEEHLNKRTRPTDNQKNLTTVGGRSYGSPAHVLKKSKNPYVPHEKWVDKNEKHQTSTSSSGRVRKSRENLE